MRDGGQEKSCTGAALGRGIQLSPGKGENRTGHSGMKEGSQTQERTFQIKEGVKDRRMGEREDVKRKKAKRKQEKETEKQVGSSPEPFPCTRSPDSRTQGLQREHWTPDIINSTLLFSVLQPPKGVAASRPGRGLAGKEVG